MRQSSRPAVPDNSAVVDDFLELSGRSATLSGSQLRLAAFVHIVEAGTIVEEHHLAQLDGGRRLQRIQAPVGVEQSPFLRTDAASARVAADPQLDEVELGSCDSHELQVSKWNPFPVLVFLFH
jgi:hypothetical protein